MGRKTEVSTFLDDSEFAMGWSHAEPTEERVALARKVDGFFAERPDVHAVYVRFLKGTPFTANVVVDLTLVTSVEYEGSRFSHSRFLHPQHFGVLRDEDFRRLLGQEADRLYLAFHDFILRDWIEAEKKRREKGGG